VAAVRLGQDRLSSVLESRTVRMGEGQPIRLRIASQAKMCNLSMKGSQKSQHENIRCEDFLVSRLREGGETPTQMAVRPPLTASVAP